MTEPLSKTPSDQPSERPARRLRRKLGNKPVISASQPGKARQVNHGRFPEPAPFEPEEYAPAIIEPTAETAEVNEPDMKDQGDNKRTVPAPPQPPTRPTRRARRAKAPTTTNNGATPSGADRPGHAGAPIAGAQAEVEIPAEPDGDALADVDAEGNLDVVQAAIITDEIEEPVDVDELVDIEEPVDVDELVDIDEPVDEEQPLDELPPQDDDYQHVEPLDLSKLPPPSGEPIALDSHDPETDHSALDHPDEEADLLPSGAETIAAEEAHTPGAHDASVDQPMTTTADDTDDPEARLAARATTPEIGQLELRQIAGLTSGVTMRLDPERYDFSENSNEGIGFQIEVDHNERALVIPGASEIKVDTVTAAEPTLIGAGVLDVGSARFLVRHRREHKRATDWLDQYESIDRPEPLINVPQGLGLDTDAAATPEPSKGFRRRKKKAAAAPVAAPALNVTSWEFIERVRATRIELADRERYLHPDPAELAERAAHRAPILGIRPPGHPLFGKVGVLVADMPWMPRFDDISAVPDSLGPYMKPLMSLPSLPIAADLMVGPLGIVGSRNATVACARHIMISLYGLSTSDLHLHVVAGDDHIDSWEWAFDIAPERAIDVGPSFPLVVVDGMENFAASGLNHNDAIDKRAGLVILAESVEDLPAYCGTVLQVDRSGGGLLTNHLGHIIAGTPIGVTTSFASTVANNLHSVMERRHNR